ncbi:SDR family NAD(P)-dependent oxidoreductase [Streptomyces sp. NBC_00154]|nr:SDR family NAD(P)-dependent oxidoreductase [Streptomyces sp. NBC_00154]
METDLFGAVWVTQAAIRYLREQGSGHILQVSSIGGITSYPNVGAYNASKWALEGISQALAGEVAPFRIKVTLIEPDSFATDFGSSLSAKFSEPHPAYDPLREALGDFQGSLQVGGDLAASAAAVLELVDLDESPLRQFFGSQPLTAATRDYESRLTTWQAGQDRAVRAGGGF